MTLNNNPVAQVNSDEGVNPENTNQVQDEERSDLAQSLPNQQDDQEEDQFVEIQEDQNQLEASEPPEGDNSPDLTDRNETEPETEDQPNSLKIVITLTDNKSVVGIRHPDTDVYFEAFTDLDLTQLIQETINVAERAEAHWAAQPLNETYYRPKAAKPPRSKRPATPSRTPGQPVATTSRQLTEPTQAPDSNPDAQQPPLAPQLF